MERSNIQKVAFIYPALVTETNIIGKLRMLIQMVELRPRLGLGYLSAALQKKGIGSRIYDQMILGFDHKKLVEALRKDKVDLVGFYLCSDSLKNAVSFIREIKKHLTVPVIAGGPGDVHYEELLQAGCEIVCFGEGDETIIDIADYYDGKKKIDGIKGIAYRDKLDGRTVITPARPLVEDLDKLPFPHRDAGIVANYYDYLAYPLKKPYISVAGSRGCTYSCAYCISHKFWRRQYRQRSVENVIDEIRGAVARFGVRSICFNDDVFGMSLDWTRDFSRAVRREKLNLRWMCNLHPMTFRENKEEAFALMADSGCKLISFGAQSANPDVLRNINRDPGEPEALRESIRLAKKVNIAPVLSYILGLPGDTRQTLQQDFDFCVETKPYMVNFHPLSVWPNSEIGMKYKEGPVCGLSAEEAVRISKEYMIKYYTRPEVAGQLIKDILVKNPMWFFTSMPFVLKVFRRFWSGRLN